MSQKPSTSEAGFVPILLLAAALIASGIVAATQLTISTEFPKILGDEGEQNGTVAPQPIRSGGGNSPDRRGGQNRGNTPDPSGNAFGLRLRENSSGAGELQIETQGGGKLKIRTEDNGKVKLEVENSHDQSASSSGQGEPETEVAPQAEQELGDLEQETELDIGGSNVKVSSHGGERTISSGLVQASSHFPISVNPVTNGLTVKTPAGDKSVTILPDQAVNNLLHTGLIDQSSSPSGEVKMEMHGNDLVFRVEGQKTRRLFGVVPVTLPTTALVSAQNGGVVATEESVLAKLVDLLSR